MKQARNANDYLKQQKHKGLFRFELSSTPTSNEAYQHLINSNMVLAEELMDSQTDIQSLVCSLYLILTQQNKVSDYLQRTTATISHHMKQGRTQVILDAFHDMIKVLNSFSGEVNGPAINQLQENIKQDVSRQLEAYFQIEKG
jgi:ABC-type transporter Mla subunit MlaD